MPDTGEDVAFGQDLARLYRSDIDGLSLLKETSAYEAIGMQALVNKIRALAPDNIIVLGGTNWDYDLSGVRQGFAITGTNLVYDIHPFNYSNKQPGDWPASFGATAQQYPVIASEFGSYDCGTSYIAQAISYFNAHHISLLAWSWTPYGCGGPSLLAAWPDTPSAPYGSYINQQIQAESQIAA